MKIPLLCTDIGLVPYGDEAYDMKKKLKVGKVYNASVTEFRNIRFHRKYFAMINKAWEYQNEKVRAFFKEDVNRFRETVEIQAGNYTMVYNISRKEWIEVPKSITFDKMDELEFRDLYKRVLDVLFEVFLHNITREAFEMDWADF